MKRRYRDGDITAGRSAIPKVAASARRSRDLRERDAPAAERRAFAHRLRNKKAVLTREADRRILTIANKYRPGGGVRFVHEQIDRVLGEFVVGGPLSSCRGPARVKRVPNPRVVIGDWGKDV
jgi:hypothetical protein